MSELPSWDVVEGLLRAPNRAALAEIRALTHQAIAAIREDESVGCGDELYGLCFLLYLVGEPEDVVLIYDAKYLNMDTGAMIDRDLLTMRCDRDTMLRTIEALSPELERPCLARDLAEAFDSPNYNSSEMLEAALCDYFGLPQSR